MKSLRRILGAGTILAGAAAARFSLSLLVFGAILLAMLAVVIVAVAAFSKRNAPMDRIRGLVRDLRGGEEPVPQRLRTASRQATDNLTSDTSNVEDGSIANIVGVRVADAAHDHSRASRTGSRRSSATPVDLGERK